ncbi:hypothetical protein ACVWW5_002290 [Bradyrhizobium sp. LM3.4]
MAAIDHGEPDLAVKSGYDLDLSVEGCQQQPCELFKQFVDVDLGRLERLLAGKRQQARRQRGTAVGGVADQLGDGRERRIVLHGVGEDLDRARDHGEHVVELVRDAAGELADRLHLLGLDQLLLGGTLLGDVLDEIVDEGASPELERRAGRLDQDLVAVPVQQGRFEPDADRRIRQFRQEPHHALPEAVAQRLGDEEVDDVRAERLLARPTGQGLGLNAPLQDDTVRIGLNEGIERGLDDGLGNLRAGLRLLGQSCGNALVLQRRDHARAEPRVQRRNETACEQGDELDRAEPGSGHGIGGEEGRRSHDDLRDHRECQKSPEFHGLTPTRRSRTLASTLSMTGST